MNFQGWMTAGCALVLAGGAGCAEGPGVDIEGRYTMRSVLQTPQGLPEREAEELVKFTELADHPDMVEKWLLDRLDDELPEFLRSALLAARAGTDIDEELRKHLSLVAPDYKDQLVELSRELKSMTQTVQVLSELDITADGDGSRGHAEHLLTGLWFDLDGEEILVDFGEPGVAEPIASSDFVINREENTGELMITFERHRTTLPYGQMLNYAINEVLVERKNPFADNISELVSGAVPCADIGQLLADLLEIESGTPQAFGVACATAFGELGRAILPDEVRLMSVSLDLEGDALLVENNDSNDRVDALVEGEWEGSLWYPSSSVYLRRPNNVFTAERSAGRRNNTNDHITQ